MMRTIAFACLLLTLSACTKFEGKDITISKGEKPVWTSPQDTIPDNSMIALKLTDGGSGSDETLFIFDKKARLSYSPNDDAAYLNGFGEVSLASVSSDNRDLAMYSLPYKRGMSVALDLHSNRDAMLNLTISREKNIPPDMKVWVKDRNVKDSLDLCKGTYSFHVATADSNSFGKHRLRLVLERPH